eukprot:1175741-Prorocentrum_minimum.AAC.1
MMEYVGRGTDLSTITCTLAGMCQAPRKIKGSRQQQGSRTLRQNDPQPVLCLAHARESASDRTTFPTPALIL